MYLYHIRWAYIWGLIYRIISLSAIRKADIRGFTTWNFMVPHIIRILRGPIEFWYCSIRNAEFKTRKTSWILAKKYQKNPSCQPGGIAVLALPCEGLGPKLCHDFECTLDRSEVARLCSSGVDEGLSPLGTCAHISEELVPPTLTTTLFIASNQSFVTFSVSQAKVMAPCLLHTIIIG